MHRRIPARLGLALFASIFLLGACAGLADEPSGGAADPSAAEQSADH